jgi:hypothetical protein
MVLTDELERAIDLHTHDGTKQCDPAAPSEQRAMIAELA